MNSFKISLAVVRKETLISFMTFLLSFVSLNSIRLNCLYRSGGVRKGNEYSPTFWKENTMISIHILLFNGYLVRQQIIRSS